MDGGEKIGKEFFDWIKKKGILHEETRLYSLDSNGPAKHLNHTLMDIAQTLLINMEIAPESLWADAINRACLKKS